MTTFVKALACMSGLVGFVAAYSAYATKSAPVRMFGAMTYVMACLQLAYFVGASYGAKGGLLAIVAYVLACGILANFVARGRQWDER